MEKLTNMERRVFDFREHREFAPHIDSENERRVIGYAIVFNQESRVLYDAKARSTFIETINPEAVTKDFLDRQDIKLNFNHDNDRILGRSLFGGGTLSYEIDEYGVRFACELPNTAAGNDVLELIRRGDVFGCSFAFTYSKDGVKDLKKGGERYRYISAFGSIDDFSIVVDPAYWGTFVTTRAYNPETEGDTGAKDPVTGVPMDLEIEMLRLESEIY